MDIGVAAALLSGAAVMAIHEARQLRYHPTIARQVPRRGVEQVRGKGSKRSPHASPGGRAPRLPGRLLDRNAQLKQSESRLLFALEAAQVGIFDWDVHAGRTVYITARTGGQGLGYRELTSAESQELIHSDDRPRVRAAVEQFLTGKTETLEASYRCRVVTWPGGWVPISVQGKAVEHTHEGRPRRVLGIYRNVAEEVERKNALRRREATVANASRLASLGELASVLGHELNQPLAALTTYVQAAARLVEVGQTGRRETVLALRRCVDLAERASEILKRVRRLVRRLPPVDEAFDLRDSVAEVAALLEAEARDCGAEIRVRKPRRAIGVRCDRVQVEQALFNLCRNALEALAESPRRRRVVQVAPEATSDGAVVRVSDNGPGIPAQLGKHVFEPFVSTKPEGSGLGLSVSKSIAEAQGGSLRLERNGPRGAVFLLQLPREKKRARGAKR